jgi:hypothetical protein
VNKKIIASGLAGLALFGGAVAFAVTGAGTASATSTAESALTQDATPNGVRGWFHGHRREIRREAVKIAADTIRMPVDELVKDLKAGQSVAEVAQAKGVDPQKIVDAWVKAADARIDKAVADGKLTQERGDKAKAKVPEVAGRAINRHRGDHKSGN